MQFIICLSVIIIIRNNLHHNNNDNNKHKNDRWAQAVQACPTKNEVLAWRSPVTFRKKAARMSWRPTDDDSIRAGEQPYLLTVGRTRIIIIIKLYTFINLSSGQFVFWFGGEKTVQKSHWKKSNSLSRVKAESYETYLHAAMFDKTSIKWD